ncbi:MAG TPA: NAD(+)/NADH kinase [Sulfurovum sp.]|nr:NAD(+)/NADH kinase [Sulfurovum sp.]
MKKLAQIKTAGFILKPEAPEIKPIYEKIKAQFEAKGLQVILSEHSAEMIGLEGVSFKKMCEEADFLVSLGGDGTLLSLVRRSYGYHKPVVGINAGNLGFLADITIEDVDSFLEQLFAGEYRIDTRMMIEGCIKTKEGKVRKFFAFNDVVITRPVVSKMAKINASIDGEWFNTYRGDGLIISTPTGSTAYSLSAGGPMMYPLTQAFILTPILAHSLSNQRPLVVPADFTIELSSPEEKVIAVIDGQDHYDMHEGDMLTIRGASEGAELLHRKERNYFSVLREKLSWGDKH